MLLGSVGLWVENNPLDACKLATQIGEVSPGSKLRELGLDDDQVETLVL